MNKRILLISFEYPLAGHYCGGVGQVVKQSRAVLMELGYDVYVLISAQFQKQYPVKLLFPDGRVVRYQNFQSFEKKQAFNNFDFIIQHFVNWTPQLKLLQAKKGTRPKIIYHFHSILRREKDSGFKIFNRFLLNQERMIEIADVVICPSRYEHENFNRYFPHFSEKVRLVENTIETFPERRKIIQSIRRHYGIKKEDIVSVYVGRLERIKGAHVLVKSLPQILKKYKNKKIFVVGKPLERRIYAQLRKICNRYPRRLFYIKHVSKDYLFQLYYLSHIYINTSLSESFSLSTHEGAFCHTALLLSKLPVFDRFKKGAAFFSDHEKNSKSFVSQYEYLLENKRLRQRLSKKAAISARHFVSECRLKNDFAKLMDDIYNT